MVMRTFPNSDVILEYFQRYQFWKRVDMAHLHGCT